jgi:ubiquitin carboxyl-terminal hydrolase L3
MAENEDLKQTVVVQNEESNQTIVVQNELSKLTISTQNEESKQTAAQNEESKQTVAQNEESKQTVAQNEESKQTVVQNEESKQTTVAQNEESKKSKRKRKKWFPLESNPPVMNRYIENLGFPTALYQFTDVFSVEDWAIQMVPQPVIAVVFLFPITEVQAKFRREQVQQIKDQGGPVGAENVYHMRQTVGNACGTVGILHAIGNARHRVPLVEGSFLQRFYDSTNNLSPDDIASFLEEDEEIEITHAVAAQEGETRTPSLHERVDTHFICFSCVDGHLFELDGGKEFPINHGPSSEETILQDSCRVIQEFISRDPNEIRFTIVALAATLYD